MNQAWQFRRKNLKKEQQSQPVENATFFGFSIIQEKKEKKKRKSKKIVKMTTHSAFKIAVSNSKFVPPLKAWVPLSKEYRMHPKDHKSAFSV